MGQWFERYLYIEISHFLKGKSYIFIPLLPFKELKHDKNIFRCYYLHNKIFTTVVFENIMQIELEKLILC